MTEFNLEDIKKIVENSIIINEKLEFMFLEQSKMVNNVFKAEKEREDREIQREKEREDRQIQQQELIYQRELQKEKRAFRKSMIMLAFGLTTAAFGFYNLKTSVDFFMDFAMRVISERRIQFAFTGQLISQMQVAEQNRLISEELSKFNKNFVDSVKALPHLKIKPNPDLDSVYPKLVKEHRIDTVPYILEFKTDQ